MTAAAKANILLVDDRPDNLLALEAILEPLGQNLIRASSGEEALKRLLKEDFHLILLVVQMPGMNGFDTAMQIKQREKTRDIPIIFLTAISREPHHALRGYSTGAVDYISKPFDPFILRAKVSLFIEIFEKNMLLKQQRELLAERLGELEKEIAQRKVAQAALQERKAVVQLLQDVAVAANEATTVQDAFQVAVNEVCGFAGWSLGRALVLDGRGLVPASAWCSGDDENLEEFRKVAHGLPTSDVGLSTSVLRERRPVWGPVDFDGRAPRLKDAAAAAGIRSCFALPIRVGSDICGVLEFYSKDEISPDESLLEVAEPVGAQVGRVVERTRVEQEMRRLDAAKTEFIANAAHELRTPLVVIAGIPDALIHHHQKMSAEELEQALATMKRQAERMRDLTNNLLDISRMDLGKISVEVSPVDLGPLVEHVLTVAPSPDARKVEADISDGLKVMADSELLDQALTNLITNAYKYGAGTTRVAAKPDSEGVLITVSDEGPGVPEEFVPHLFEPFARGPTTSSIAGSGLGLAITRRIVRSLGGEVWYEPKSPAGASFNIRMTAPM